MNDELEQPFMDDITIPFSGLQWLCWNAGRLVKRIKVL